jgi:dihydrofolate synthase / folylpolyglutamate synthase
MNPSVMPTSPIPVLDSLSEWGTFRPGLEAIRSVLGALGHPERRFRHILVGGTNGKGTVSATLARELGRVAAAQEGGEVGLFLSPHLMDVRERITLWGGEPRGQWLPDAVWRRAHNRIQAAVPGVELSYFEWLLALAVVLFAERRVTTAVFEVGVGGRDDATNALDPALSVITGVGLDHTALLGNTLDAIALHKVGIGRPGRPLVLPASLLRRPPVAAALEALGPVLVTFEADSLADSFEANRRAVTTALFCLGIATRDIAIQPLPGRREVLPVGAGVYLDGAHNPDAWTAMARWLETVHGPEPIRALINLSQGRESQRLLDALAPIARNFTYWDDPAWRHPRELPATAWPPEVRRVTTAELPALLQEPLLVCGSLYTVGRFRRWLAATGVEFP